MSSLLYFCWTVLELLTFLLSSKVGLEFAASATAAMGPIRSHLNPAPVSVGQSLGTYGCVRKASVPAYSNSRALVFFRSLKSPNPPCPLLNVRPLEVKDSIITFKNFLL